jgi:NADPH:quinone reductase-like Zn-dependent oxidoreductase
MRIAGFGVRRPKHANPGRSLAGTVVAVGPDVENLQPGDEVFGIGDATFADLAVARGSKVVAKPATVGFAAAAAVSISGLAALQVVRHARVAPGQRVAITGAAGGVGSLAVQIAKAAGAEVTGIVSTAKMDAVRTIGADHAFDYTREDFTDGNHRFDVILDVAGNRSLRSLRRALTPTGTLVIVGGEGHGKLLGGSDRQIRAQLLSPFVRQRLGTFFPAEKGEDLRELAALMESGALVPTVDRTYALAETAGAIRALLDGRVHGKLAIAVDGTPD